MAANLNNEKIINVAGRAAPHFPVKQEAKACPDVANCELLTGIEIELEDWISGGIATLDYENWWTMHDEGSLRNGREFVLYPPQNGSNLADAVRAFFRSGAKWTPSERASVHIHLDMTNVVVWQFRSLFSLCYALEGSIYRVADENRKWASYSCPLIEMRAERLTGVLAAKSQVELKRALVGGYHEERYYGFNVASIAKHGTVEFRYFPCTTSEATIFSWINLCHELFTVAMQLPVPGLLRAMRTMGVVQFIRTYLPRSAEALIGYVDTEEVLQRLKQCAAIAADGNAAKRRSPPATDTEITNRAYLKMLRKVCAPVFAAKKPNPVKTEEEVFTMQDLYEQFVRDIVVEQEEW